MFRFHLFRKTAMRRTFSPIVILPAILLLGAGTPPSATQPMKVVTVNVEADTRFTAEMQKGLTVYATVYSSKDVPTIDGFSIPYGQTLHIDFNDEFRKIKTTEMSRRVVLQVKRSARCPYEGQLEFDISQSVLEKPPTDLVLKLHPLEAKKIVLTLLDDATGRPVTGQPIALMESFNDSVAEVHAESTDSSGQATFFLWTDLKYSFELKLGGPATETSQFLALSPQLLKDAKTSWKIKITKSLEPK